MCGRPVVRIGQIAGELQLISVTNGNVQHLVAYISDRVDPIQRLPVRSIINKWLRAESILQEVVQPVAIAVDIGAGIMGCFLYRDY